MPFPRNWAEELLVEWLHLDGYLVEANLAVGVARAGGRLEADIVGAKITGGILEIKHIESGLLSGGEAQAKRIVQTKFSRAIRHHLTSYFRRQFNFRGRFERVKYRRIYVPTWPVGPPIALLQRKGVEVILLQDVISTDIIKAMNRWKDAPPYKARTSGQYIMLPEAYWLLKLIEHMYSYGLLNEERLRPLRSEKP